jgi:hypothetical protein
MSGGGQVRLDDIVKMLAGCAEGFRMKEAKRCLQVTFNGRTARLRNPPPSKHNPEYRASEVRNLVRMLGLDEAAVRKHLPNLKLGHGESAQESAG